MNSRPRSRPFRVSAVCALVVGAAVTSAYAVAPGDTAPAFVIPGEDGAQLALADLRGRVVLVDFWASWCAPCRRSFPWLNDMAQKYGPRGFTVVGVNVDKKHADAMRFLQQFPARFALAFDEAGTTPAAFDVKGMPSSYLIDARGKVVLVETGFSDERKDALEEKIRALLPAVVPGR